MAKAKEAIWLTEKARLKELEDNLQVQSEQLPEHKELVIAQAKADAEIARLNDLITSETKRFDAEVAKVKNTPNDGINDRDAALDLVTKDHPVMPRVIMAILFFLESLSVTGKLFLGADEYVLEIASANEAAKDKIKLKDAERQTIHEQNMGNETSKLIDLRSIKYTNDAKLTEMGVNHQNNILEILTPNLDLSAKLALINEREAILRELVGKQKAIADLNDELQGITVQNGKLKKKRA